MTKLRHKKDRRYLCMIQQRWMNAKPQIPGHWAEVSWYQPNPNLPGEWILVWEHDDKEAVQSAMKKAGNRPNF